MRIPIKGWLAPSEKQKKKWHSSMRHMFHHEEKKGYSRAEDVHRFQSNSRSLQKVEFDSRMKKCLIGMHGIERFAPENGR